MKFAIRELDLTSVCVSLLHPLWYYNPPSPKTTPGGHPDKVS